TTRRHRAQHRGKRATLAATRPSAPAINKMKTQASSSDRWGESSIRVLRKTSRTSISSAGRGTESTRVSLANVLKSRDVKDLVKTAIVTSTGTRSARCRPRTAVHATALEERSSVMGALDEDIAASKPGHEASAAQTRRPTTANSDAETGGGDDADTARS
ncbi:hypothetical protein PINS_up024048, partial [Pythium insidiosum]